MVKIVLQYIFLVVGLGFGYVISEVMLRKNKALYKFTTAMKKKKFIAFLETDKAIYGRIIKKIYRNLAITEQKEIIILPKSSPKPCVNLGGAMIVHGDLYKSVAVPQEVRKFIHERKKEGWKEEDIAQFLEEIETTPPEVLKPLLHKLKFWKKKKVGDNKTSQGDKEETPIDLGSNPAPPNLPNVPPVTRVSKRKYDVYMSLPSVVKDFIYTGLNRVSIHTMLRELVYQRDLEKWGQRNWLMIGIAIMIILLGVGFAIRFIFGTPGIAETIGEMVGVSRVAP